jgi:hypothetical protein
MSLRHLAEDPPAKRFELCATARLELGLSDHAQS